MLSENATVPPLGIGEIVAVKVTAVPAVDGFADEDNVVAVAVRGLTTCANAAEVEPVKLPLPENAAVTLSVSAPVKLKVQVALPVAVDTGWAVQAVICFMLSENATVPPLGVGETVAVKVTIWPTIDGLADDARAVLVVVVAALTTWASSDNAEPEKLVSPLYVAVTLSVSAPAKVTVQVALPVDVDTG
jgi:hypothetical protein